LEIVIGTYATRPEKAPNVAVMKAADSVTGPSIVNCVGLSVPLYELVPEPVHALNA